MEMIDYNTRLFKNIFPDYNTFATWYKGLPLSDDDSDCPLEKTFTLIAFEFNDSHVAFSPDSFKEHFANDIYTYYREFEATTKSILELMKLTDEEIAVENQNILNIANIPETEISTDEEVVDFISTQNKTINKKGKLQIKREQLAIKKAFTVKTFVNRFRHLFIKIISPACTFVVAEPDEE